MHALPVRIEAVFTGLVSFTEISAQVHIMPRANKRKSLSRNELVRVVIN